MRRTARGAFDLWAFALLAALVRFPTLGRQSYWHDEAVTAARVLRPTLGATIGEVPDSESSPPLYYVLAWVWSRVFGTGELGLRSLSAIFGVGTVVFVYLTAREVASRRAARIAALLTAVNPFLVWYSQEARAYALVTMLSAGSAWLLVRALRDESPRWLVLWAVVSGLALATHYFALFLIAPEAALLLYAHPRRRRALAAVAGTTVAGLALLPLALDQAAAGRNDWIAHIALGSRLRHLVEQLVAGEHGSPVAGVHVVAGLAFLAAVALAGRAMRGSAGRRLAYLAGAAAAVVVLPLAAIAVGQDFFLTKNLAPALPVVFVLAGVGLATLPMQLSRAWTAVLAAGFLAFTLATFFDAKVERTDWRAVARAIAPDHPDLVVAPAVGDDPLAYYLPGGATVVRAAAAVRRVDAIGWPVAGGHDSRPPTRGFRRRRGREVAGMDLVRYASPTPRRVSRRRALAARIGVEPAKLVAPRFRAGGR
ncbi:MAG: glycosyltransferase family 39 protein [Thermoleophilaceae bacterium]